MGGGGEQTSYHPVYPARASEFRPISEVHDIHEMMISHRLSLANGDLQCFFFSPNCSAVMIHNGLNNGVHADDREAVYRKVSIGKAQRLHRTLVLTQT